MKENPSETKNVLDPFENFDFDPDLFDMPEKEPEPEINIDGCIVRTLMALDTYRLDEAEEQTIRDFLTFRIQTRRQWHEKQETQKAYFNLMLVSEEPDTAKRVATVLWEALNISRSDVTVLTEQAAIRRCETRSRVENPLFGEDDRMLVITDCREAPKLDVNGGGSARDRSAKEIEAYRSLWQKVCELAVLRPDVTVIVCCKPSVYKNTMRNNTDLSKRICAHHIHLKERTVEELLEDCLEELKASSLRPSKGFIKALREYFPVAYRLSDLRGKAFVEELVSRIYTRYFSRQRKNNTLTEDCVPDDNPRFQTTETVLGKLNELVGLQSAKEELSNIHKMQLAGLAEGKGRYHMLFTGNPGTGKTTVAKMTAELLYSMNVIRKNKLVVAKPSDMVSEWIGGTGIKAMEVIRRAYGGVLFIDEAYGIASMDRGNELLNILVQEMENNSDKLAVIFAGYPHEMRKLMKANPGLASRISREIPFEDYNQEELVQIFMLMCKQEGFSLDPSAQDELEDCIAALMTKEFFGNAREIRTMLQDLKEAWSEEYYEAAQKSGNKEVALERVFGPQHFAKIMPPKKQVGIQDLIGLSVLKEKLESFKKQAMFQRYLQEKGFSGISDFSMHMVFTGNPGTGKTTVAKLIADDLYSVGMLKTNRLVVVERKDLVSAYGDTAKKTADAIRRAVGGVLFVDEAYALAGGSRSLGNECIEVFLTAMEEHKSDTVIIFAGYVDEMQDFLAMNPGIQSRIGYTFHFDDYSTDELTDIYARKMRKLGFQVSDSALKKVRGIMDYFRDIKNFGNGRFVDHVIHQTINQRANRDFTNQYRNICGQDIPSFKTLVATAPNSMQLYDPGTITPDEHRRTAIHELGHAVVMVKTDPKNIPESISIRNQAGSYGRVKLAGTTSRQTEQTLLNLLATLLGGKNAENLLTGTHSTGCVGDYTRAKRIAGDMVSQFAMTAYGKNAKEILESADKLACEIIAENQAAIEELANILLEKKEISGKDFVKALKQCGK